jgi:MoaA/NifB/PqqE/SkfB family radical SAM enzyme
VSINPERIEAIAAELVVDASLVEKDWYAVRIIAAISRVKHPTMRLVFSGGTSLREYRERIVEAICAGSEDGTVCLTSANGTNPWYG